MSWLDNFLQWLAQPEVRDKVLPAVLAGLLVALLIWLAKRTGLLVRVARLGLGWMARRAWDPLAEPLEAYHAALDRRCFEVKHAWMKEGQTLRNILVPVVIESDQLAGGIEDWSTVLVQYFHGAARAKPPSPGRLAVIGGPGSGKSVALKVAAREAWRLPAADNRRTLVPVLFTFADFRRAGFDLLEAVTQGLHAGGFSLGTATPQGDPVRQFAEAGLRDGTLLVIIDALDELEREDRRLAAEGLTAELKRFPAAPAIFSCRKAAWHDQLAEVRHERVTMADFTPAAIRQFVRQWDFTPPKSADDLWHAIQSQPHLGDLARSPLLLTIIAFLYSQPKYHLPENRAEFYDVCSRALLEEWDQARSPDRANRFERHHKEYVLSELAYRHLCGPTPDADLEERETLDTIAEVMRRYSLREKENLRLLSEICENSGLLVRLPPSGLRFPHQTFLEFFTALHLHREGDQARVFQHYAEDAPRWREVLLLFIGLTTNAEHGSSAIARLQETDTLEMTLAALADARALKPEVAEDVLDHCAAVVEKDPQPGLITLLGYVGSNPRTAHSEVALDILGRLLRSTAARASRLPPPVLEALLLACLRRPAEDTAQFVVDHLEQLDLRRLLPHMGERAFILSARIIGDPHLAEGKKLEWIDGLRRAEGVRPLLELLTRPQLGRTLRDASAVALVRLSKAAAFHQEVAAWGDARNLNDPATEAALDRWGWPFAHPATEAGRRLMVHLSVRLADQPIQQSPLYEAIGKEADGRLLYLASGLRLQTRTAGVFCEHKRLSATSVSVARSIWRKSAHARWVRAMMAGRAGMSSLETLPLLLGLLVILWSILATFTGLFGWTSLGLHWPVRVVVSTAMIASAVIPWTHLAARGWERIRECFVFGLFLHLTLHLWVKFYSDLSGRRGQLIVIMSGLGWLLAAGAAAAFVSDYLAIRTVFSLTVALQALAGYRLAWPGATPPLLANEHTKALCKYLTEADQAALPGGGR